MYDGKQAVRLETKFKSKDLYNIGVEMKERKGTGNYDKDRHEFNVEYVSMNEKKLYQEVKQTLKNRGIEYLNKPSTNLLNGITFTSGPEFFEALGMKFVDSGRTYKSGNKKGQIIKILDIKSSNDIPPAVSYFFDSCMEYLKDLVGEENIILAQIHYDEDTPHLQAYFLPIVNEVKRKCFVKDKDGNVVKEEYKRKDGSISLTPKILRDKDGKIVYESVKGKFLNNDQFWKDKGGQNSFAKIQDSFNKFITERGFKLDRGNIGTNVEHQTKLEHQIAENKAELEEIIKEKENALQVIKDSKLAIENANNSVDKDILNPKKNMLGYNKDDVDKMIDYSKDLEKKNILQEQEIKNKDLTIDKLTKENSTFKNNTELVKRNNLIKEQKETISKQKKEITRLSDLVEVLNNNIKTLKEKLNKEIEYWKNLFNKLANAIDKVLGREPKEYADDYEDLADAINNDYYDYDKDDMDKDDFDRGF